MVTSVLAIDHEDTGTKLSFHLLPLAFPLKCIWVCYLNLCPYNQGQPAHCQPELALAAMLPDRIYCSGWLLLLPTAGFDCSKRLYSTWVTSETEYLTHRQPLAMSAIVCGSKTH